METLREVEARPENGPVESQLLYIEGLSHLQGREWKKAVRCLSSLEERYPHSVELRTLLEEARWKASLEEKAPLPKGIRPSFLSHRLVRALLVANIIVYAGWGIFTIYNQRVRPGLERRREESYQANLLHEGQRELAEGDYEGAIQRFEEVLARSPGNREAQAGMSEAREMAALDALHEQGLDLIEAEQGDEALVPLEEIAQQESGYKVEKQAALANLFGEAEGLYRDSRWLEAAAKYEEIRAMDLSYQQKVVEDHLFESYLNGGESQVALAGETLEPLQEATGLFEKALALRPLEPRVLAERSLAKACLEGSSLYGQEDWAGVIAELQGVYEVRPEYANGKVAQWLYGAYMARGDKYVEGEGYPSALEEYGNALGIAGQTGDEGASMLFEAHHKLAEVYAVEGEGELAVEHYQEALAAGGLGGDRGSESPFDAYLASADAAVREGDYPRALEQYRRVLSDERLQSTFFLKEAIGNYATGKQGEEPMLARWPSFLQEAIRNYVTSHLSDELRTMILPLLVGVLVVLSITCIWQGLRSARPRTLEKLDQLPDAQQFREETKPKPSLFERIVKPVLQGLVNAAGRLAPKRNVERLRHDLAAAGNPHGLSATDVLGLKVLAALAASVLTLLLLRSASDVKTRVLGLALIPLGFYLPNLWLSRRISARKTEIVRALPDALDMLTVCVDAGLGFDAALLKLGEKWRNALATEFVWVVGEIGRGVTRREALRNLVARCDVPDLSSFVTAIIQADELGLSITKILHVQSQRLRMRRRQRAEQLARQAPIKMLFPLVLLILPAMFAVIFGPAVPTFIETLSNLAW